MINTIDMQRMRYINLFGKVCKVSTKHCFLYNNSIIFVVPKKKVSLAVGKNGENMRKLGDILRKKIKVVAELPEEEEKKKEEMQRFVSAIVDPITFNKVEVKGGEIVITAGRQSKAALIGRNRQREKELEGILKNFFAIGKLRIA